MELKQAIIVRTDLKMDKGKIAAQASHASVAAYHKSLQKNKDKADEWFDSGMQKIVLKASSKEELMKLKEKAARASLVAEVIKDAGRTQIPAGSITALGIGPEIEDKIDAVIKDLKLL
ncbi:MAG: peptidyl-tRNA hydrolase [Nanoarchaeota archaeon]|nr:peptidyl-tRNA hydrolase [Nanoarchaeota archaeon]